MDDASEPLLKRTLVKAVLISISLALSSLGFSQLPFFFGGNGDGSAVNCLGQSSSVSSGIYVGGDGNGVALYCYTQQIDSTGVLYSGGVGDGIAYNCFIQVSSIPTGVFLGGDGGGSNQFCFLQSSSAEAIFNGGQGNGEAVYCYLQGYTPVQNMYSGGTGDGFNVNCYMQNYSSNFLHMGGIGSGDEVNCYLQQVYQMNLFGGGDSDGFGLYCYIQNDYIILLPIELVYFEAHREDDIIRIDWETISETNNDYFEVLASSDLVAWTQIDQIDGAGTSLETNRYYTYDYNPSNGNNYYQLRMTDFDGEQTYSPIVSVLDEGESVENQLSIYPNPASDFVNIQLNGFQSDKLVLQVYNTMGMLETELELFLHNGVGVFGLQTADKLPNGNHIWVIKDANTGDLLARKVITISK